MRIVVTGSIGNVGKPLTTKLVQKGHTVTVVSSNADKQKDIEVIGAESATGKLEDVEFLISTFAGADAVYCMIPIRFKEADLIAYFTKIARNYVLAIQEAAIKQAVVLSGWAAGVLSSYRGIEDIFNELPDAAVTYIRPGYFYSNFLESIEVMKAKSTIAATFGGEDRIVFSSPYDIADAVVDELTHHNHDRNIRYVVSDEMTCNEAAKILGAAIGKPDLKWITVGAEEMQKNLEHAGLSPKLVSDVLEMQAPIHEGIMAQEFARNRAAFMGKVKLTDFAKEFAAVYNRK